MNFLSLLHALIIFATMTIINGTDTFEQPLLESEFTRNLKKGTLVDKSELVLPLLTHGNEYYILLTRPRGYGKTFNLHMIKDLLGIVVDQHGKRIAPQDHPHFKLFNETLNVFRDETFVKMHFCRYPIIHLDFKSMFGSTYEEYGGALKHVILNSFNQYEWLIKTFSPTVAPVHRTVNRDRFIRFNHEIRTGNVDEFRLVRVALPLFLNFLYDFFRQQVIILIDNYDCPKTKALENKVDDAKVNDLINDLIQGVVSANWRVHLAFLCGTSALLAELRSNLYKVNKFWFSRYDVFSKYYGFGADEVDELFRQRKLTDEQRHTAAEWYGGYATQGSRFRTYNPSSVMAFLRNNAAEVGAMCAFSDTGKLVLRRGALNKEILTKLLVLLGGGSIGFGFNPKTPHFNNAAFKHILQNETFDYSFPYVSVYFTYLVDQGYVTLTEVADQYRMPNLEVQRLLVELLASEQRLVIPLEAAATSLYELLEGDKDPSADRLKETMDRIVTACNTLGYIKAGDIHYAQPNEYYAYGIMCLVAYRAELGHKFKRQTTSLGEAIMLLTGRDTGMVINFTRGVGMDGALEGAKNYAHQVRWREGVRTTKCLGINLERNLTFSIKCEVVPVQGMSGV